MPKIYSEAERNAIRQRLHEEANSCLQQFGVKKTTVDMLVERVGIPKGTFYLFYKSKELLLFEAIQDYHEQIEQEMIQKCRKLGNELNVENMTEIIVSGILSVQNSCLKMLMIPEQMDALIQKLPQEVVAEHLSHDEDLMLQMLKGMPVRIGEKEGRTYSGAFRAIFFACMYHNEIGTENYEDSIGKLVKGLLIQIMEGKYD